MDLRTRLERAGVLRRLRAEIPGPQGVSPAPARRASGPPLESFVDGTWVDARHGRCFVVDRTYPLEHAQGRHRLGDLLQIPAETWSPFLREGAEGSFTPQGAIFLDTETTGLVRGAGTYAFLVGVGFFEGKAFRLVQYFMPDYGDEALMLELLGGTLAGRGGLVTYNGRSFDWPILRNRFVLQSRDPPEEGPHLDLLPLSRRLWGRRLDSCALSSVERHVLEFRRTGEDVPGYEIPQLYDDYVRWGIAEPLARVFYHNEVDILSLVSLAARAGEILAAPTAPGDVYHDHCALGRLLESVGRLKEALELYRIAAENGHEEDRALADRSRSFLLKRLGRLEEAMAVWEGRLGGDELYPYVELAKQLEHRLHDYEAARRIVLLSIGWLHAQEADPKSPHATDALAELRHRLARLERRIERQAAEELGADSVPGSGPATPSCQAGRHRA